MRDFKQRAPDLSSCSATANVSTTDATIHVSYENVSTQRKRNNEDRYIRRRNFAFAAWLNFYEYAYKNNTWEEGTERIKNLLLFLAGNANKCTSFDA